jgi:hypothetical protein
MLDWLWISLAAILQCSEGIRQLFMVAAEIV